MKTLLAATSIALIAFAAPGIAANDHAEHMDMNHHDHGKHGQAAAEAPLADGVVKKVDKAAGKVTLSHGPLPSGMPAMTMAYTLKNAAWAAQLKEGQKIRFAAEEVNGVMTVLRFEAVK